MKLKKNILIPIGVGVVAFVIGFYAGRDMVINKVNEQVRANIAATNSTKKEDVKKEEPKKETPKKEEIKELKIGETLKITGDKGEWEFTLEGIRTTDKRNQYSEKKPKKVIMVDYNYSNISYNDDLRVFEGIHFKLMDEEGNVLDRYPVSDDTRAGKAVPVGGKSKATEAMAVETDSKKVTIVFYAGNRNPIAKGVIDIK